MLVFGHGHHLVSVIRRGQLFLEPDQRWGLPRRGDPDAPVGRLPALRYAIWNDFDQAVAAASALQSMERLGLASAGRLDVEGEVRARLADELEDRRAGVAAALTPLNADLASSADAMLAGVRSGEVAYADAVQEALAGGAPALLDELTYLRLAIERAELDRNAAEVGR